MWRIEPETLLLLQDGKLRHHIVFTSLAFQHRHPQRVQMPPSGFQTAAVMAVVGELVGIGAATMAPCQSIGRAWLRSDVDAGFGRPSLVVTSCSRNALSHLVTPSMMRGSHLGLNGPENRSTLLSLCPRDAQRDDDSKQGV